MTPVFLSERFLFTVYFDFTRIRNRDELNIKSLSIKIYHYACRIIPRKNKNAPEITPSKIMQIGMGFWASKAMLTAVKLDLYTMLAPGPLSERQIKEKLGFGCSDRHVFDWLDTLVSWAFWNE